MSNFWIIETGAGSALDIFENAGNAVAVDGENNVIVAGNTEAGDAALTDSNQIFVAKYSPKGNLLWQRSLGDNPGTERAYAVDVNYENKIIVGGSTLPDGAATVQTYAVSLDSDGELIWQHSLDTGSLQGSIQGVAANPSDPSQFGSLNPGGATFVGTVGTGSSQRTIMYRYDPAATPKVIWQYGYEQDNVSGRTDFEAFDVSSSKSFSTVSGVPYAANQLLHVVGSYTTTATGSDCFFATIEGSGGIGGLNGAVGLSGSNTDKFLAVSQIGPSRYYLNTICTGFTDSPSSGSDEVILVARYTAIFSGYKWSMAFGGNGGKTGRGLGVAQDSQDRDTANSYVVGYTQPTTAANATEGYILKLAPSQDTGPTVPSVLWQRKITATGVDSNGGAVRLTGVKVDYNGDVVVSGITSNESTISTGESNVFVAKLPSDGSGTGTFGRFTYAAESLYVNTSPGLYNVGMGIYNPDAQTYSEAAVPTLENDDTSQFTVVE